MLTEYYFAVRYGDIIILLYHEDMMSVWELLFKNSQKEKALKAFCLAAALISSLE